MHRRTQKPKRKQKKRKQHYKGSVNELPENSKIEQLINPVADSAERAVLEAVLSPKTGIIIIEESAMKKIQQFNKKKVAATQRPRSHIGIQKPKSQRTPPYTYKDRYVLYSPALQSLLRISNDAQCRAQQRCEMRCNDKYVGKKKNECEDICEEKYECPETDDTQEDSQDQEDPCELGDDCGDDSCGTDCQQISTKGYTLEPDSRDKCPRC